LRITHISVTDIEGGAARAAYRLHVGFCQIGHGSRMLVAERASPDPYVTAFSQSRLAPLLRRLRYRKLSPRYWHCFLSRPAGYGPFTGPRSRQGVALVSQLPDAAVLNLHRIADLLDYQTFFSSVTVHTPVVWTQDDMNAFTGGCADNRGCNGFERSCGACPQLGSSEPTDSSHQNWKRKEAIYRSIPRGRLQIVTPSRWMAGEVVPSSLMTDFPASEIPNSLNAQVFTVGIVFNARASSGSRMWRAWCFFRRLPWQRRMQNGFSMEWDGTGLDTPVLRCAKPQTRASCLSSTTKTCESGGFLALLPYPGSKHS
jgi:hypothetical protein